MSNNSTNPMLIIMLFTHHHTLIARCVLVVASIVFIRRISSRLKTTTFVYIDGCSISEIFHQNNICLFLCLTCSLTLTVCCFTVCVVCSFVDTYTSVHTHNVSLFHLVLWTEIFFFAFIVITNNTSNVKLCLFGSHKLRFFGFVQFNYCWATFQMFVIAKQKWFFKTQPFVLFFFFFLLGPLALLCCTRDAQTKMHIYTQNFQMK